MEFHNLTLHTLYIFVIYCYGSEHGRRQKFFQEEQWKKRPKISKKYRKIALFSLFQEGGGATKKKDRKIAKKGRKISLLSLYLLYLYHVWKSRGRGHGPSLPTPMVARDVKVIDIIWSPCESTWMLASPYEIIVVYTAKYKFGSFILINVINLQYI